MKANARYKRHLLRELERSGPLLSRDIAQHSTTPRNPHPWWGKRQVALMLMILEARGVVAVVGRRNGQRLWDLAERWYPETETVPLREAERILAERRYRAQGVRQTPKGWEAHPDAEDGPVPDRATLLSPFDRLIHDRNRAEALWDFHYRLEMYVPRAKREYGYYVLPLLVGDRLVGRAEPVFDRKTKTLELRGAWGDTSRLDEAIADLSAWLGAERIERSASSSHAPLTCRSSRPGRVSAGHEARATLAARDCGRFLYLTSFGGIGETETVPPTSRRRPRCASSVAPYFIQYAGSLRPCIATSSAPRRRAPFRQALTGSES